MFTLQGFFDWLNKVCILVSFGLEIRNAARALLFILFILYTCVIMLQIIRLIVSHFILCGSLQFYDYLFNNESMEKSLNLALESSLNSSDGCSWSCCESCCSGFPAVVVGSIFISLFRGFRKNFVLIWNLAGLWLTPGGAWISGRAWFSVAAWDVAIMVVTNVAAAVLGGIVLRKLWRQARSSPPVLAGFTLAKGLMGLTAAGVGVGAKLPVVYALGPKHFRKFCTCSKLSFSILCFGCLCLSSFSSSAS